MKFPRIYAWGGGHSDYMAVHLRKLNPNVSASLEHFDFKKWYVYKEVSLESADVTEYFVG